MGVIRTGFLGTPMARLLDMGMSYKHRVLWLKQGPWMVPAKVSHPQREQTSKGFCASTMALGRKGERPGADTFLSLKFFIPTAR